MAKKNSTKFRNLKKSVFIEKMKATLGNITASCEEAMIDRKTYYNWLKDDPKFASEVEAVSESSIDFAENSLMKQIRDGNPTATIFYLKTKGKKRGYVETTEVTGKDGSPLIPSKMTDEEILKEIERLRKIGD